MTKKSEDGMRRAEQHRREAGEERRSDARERDVLRVAAGEIGVPLPEEIGEAALARAQRRFWEWYARVCREQESAAEKRATEAGVARFIERVEARLAAADAPVLRIDAPPPYRAPGADGPISRTLSVASAMRAAPLLEIGVAAGAGRELWDEVPDAWVSLPDDLPQGRYLALRVSGDSMEPLLRPGDVVLVDLLAGAAQGAVIVARNAEDGYVVKRVIGGDDHTIELGSVNPDYPPVRVTPGPGTVLGRVLVRWSPAHRDRPLTR
jgi:SOS-response transcriptional repressor LexA